MATMMGRVCTVFAFSIRKVADMGASTSSSRLGPPMGLSLVMGVSKGT